MTIPQLSDHNWNFNVEVINDGAIIDPSRASQQVAAIIHSIFESPPPLYSAAQLENRLWKDHGVTYVDPPPAYDLLDAPPAYVLTPIKEKFKLENLHLNSLYISYGSENIHEQISTVKRAIGISEYKNEFIKLLTAVSNAKFLLEVQADLEYQLSNVNDSELTEEKKLLFTIGANSKIKQITQVLDFLDKKASQIQERIQIYESENSIDLTHFTIQERCDIFMKAFDKQFKELRSKLASQVGANIRKPEICKNIEILNAEIHAIEQRDRQSQFHSYPISDITTAGKKAERKKLEEELASHAEIDARVEELTAFLDEYITRLTDDSAAIYLNL